MFSSDLLLVVRQAHHERILIIPFTLTRVGPCRSGSNCCAATRKYVRPELVKGCSYPLSRRTLTGIGKTGLHLRSGHRNSVIPSAARNLKSITERPDGQSHACIVTENQPGQKISVSALRWDRHFRFFDSAALRMTVRRLLSHSWKRIDGKMPTPVSPAGERYGEEVPAVT